MAIALNQVPGLNFQTVNLDWFPIFGNVSVHMRNRYATREEVKTERLDCRQITHGTIGDISDAFQGEADQSVHFANQGAGAWFRVDVLNHHDPWFGNGCNVAPPVHVLVISPTNYRSRSRLHLTRCGVSKHRAKARKLTMQHGARNGAFVAHSCFESLNCVRDRACAELLKPLEVRVG